VSAANVCRSTADSCVSAANVCRSAGEFCVSTANVCRSTGDFCVSTANVCRSTGEFCESAANVCRSTELRCARRRQPLRRAHRSLRPLRAVFDIRTVRERRALCMGKHPPRTHPGHRNARARPTLAPHRATRTPAERERPGPISQPAPGAGSFTSGGAMAAGQEVMASQPEGSLPSAPLPIACFTLHLP
jgi:hypothetical protein